MKPTKFTRSNVNEKTLEFAPIGRSSFNLSHSVNCSLPLGKYIPVNIEQCMPGDVYSGNVKPSFQMELIQTPQIGRVRMDTHTIAVNRHRINSDFKYFVQGNFESPQYQTLPYFNASHLISAILFWLTRYNQSFDVNGNILNDYLSYNPDFDILASFQITDKENILVDGQQAFLSQPGFMLLCECADRFRDFLGSLSQDKTLYNLDFIEVEYRRILSLIDSVYARYNNRQQVLVSHGSSSFSLIPGTSGYFDEEYLVSDAICDILKPYFGEGSNMDMLGYPIVTRFTSYIKYLRDFELASFASYLRTALPGTSYKYVTFRENGRLGWNIPASVDPSDVTFTSNTPFAYLSQIKPSDLLYVQNCEVVYDVPGFGIDLQTNFDGNADFAEEPLRAVYAAWFDVLRNWHLEKRDNCLDPDTFYSFSVLSDVYHTLTDFNFFSACCLLVSRYAGYSDDFFTTIQTDDVFRHVYTPIPNQSSYGQVSVDGNSISDPFDSIHRILVDSMQVLFPAGIFNRNSVSSSVQCLKEDLQTVKRTKMLESWLARNYFNPDNYSGQISAHWDLHPSDYSVRCSQYVGGSESFITGDQKHAATGTEDTPAGTRTLVADAVMTVSDDYNYASNGDFVYLVSFVSLIPMVTYDSANMHLTELTRLELPFPEFASDSRCSVRNDQLVRGLYSNPAVVGYVPRNYSYRVRCDEAHGKYLTDRRSFCWLRDWYAVHGSYQYGRPAPIGSDFVLSPYDLHVHMPLDAFLGLMPWDDVVYGTIEVDNIVSRLLPAAVEIY